jgi:DNA invertase Pin-like site-specific DNA recombinase
MATKDREQLFNILGLVHTGDVLVVTKLDRLARSVADLQRIVKLLLDKGACLRVLSPPMDTEKESGKAFLKTLGVFADFEIHLYRERQFEGIALAKTAGRYTGPKPVIDAAAVRRLREDGKGATAIARTLGISRPSVYRLLGDAPYRGKAIRARNPASDVPAPDRPALQRDLADPD